MCHLARTFEDDALVHAQARGEDIAPKNSGPMDLHAMLRADISGHFAADDDRTGVDLPMNPGPLAHDQGVRGVDFPAERAADPYGALKAELSLEFAPVIDH